LLRFIQKVANIRYYRYRHKILGSKVMVPTYVLGGILADDMGLGKTLTMLAAITTSLTEARHFTRSGPRPSEVNATNLLKVKSTLVVVPSAG
jgi:SWI/SNF-related matrix-associated actin-dependent regulator of chromatin subfamily A3